MAEKHSLTPDSLSGFGAYGSEQKRIKLEEQNLQQGKGQLDPHNAPPSRVVHARAVPDGCTHTLLINVLAQFGKISYITMMPKLRQALIEFEKIEDAIGCVTHCQVCVNYLNPFRGLPPMGIQLLVVLFSSDLKFA
jgi:heterogeneous nuclear ribonucleoprotein L